jgi:hypothetical protein
MSSQISRNDACPCGSGEKYKNCCDQKSRILTAGQKKVIGFSLVAIAGIVVALMMVANNNPTISPNFSPSSLPAGSQSGVPAAGGLGRPPGPAPAGKVWSFEHNHWHDAPGAIPGQAAQPGAASGTQTLGNTSLPAGQSTTPRPPGPAPPGKVWNQAHGHWHDAPAGTVAGGTGP